MAIPAPTMQAPVQAPTKPAAVTPQVAIAQALNGEALKLQQPIAIVVQRMPEEKKDHAGEFIAGSIGIAGTLIGVAVTIAYTEWQRRKDERAKTDAACNDLYRKLMQMYSFVHQFIKHIDTGMEKAKENGEVYFSPRVQPYANLPEAIIFTSEEINQARKIVGYDATNEIPKIEQLYTSIVSTLQIYRERFIAVQESGTVKELGEKGVVLSFDAKDMPRVEAEYSMMDDLITEMRDMADGIKNDAFAFVLKFVEGLATYFNRHQGVRITKPDGVVETFEWNLERKGKKRKP
jgi:hypothetical protein